VSSDYDALGDGDLVALCLGGRQAAYGVLVARHKQPLYRLILAHVRDADEALDLVQETFVAAHMALRRFDQQRSLRAWLSRIAINKCRDWARRRRVRQWFSRFTPIEDGNDVADETADTEGAAIGRDLLRRTLDDIDRLPTTLRQPLLLCTVDELSQAEAAEALGVSVKAIETRLRRARAILASDRAAR
jgi:RNA polymerase sigma-70 factor (ECF subfamily)